MPPLPPLSAQPYDTVYNVLNSARVRLNDKILSQQAISGKLLENNQAFTLQLVNTAFRKLQEFLANLGFGQLRQEAVITGIPVVASLDPASQVRIDWWNYFDGANTFPGPVLPVDLMVPLLLWERQSGTNAAFVPMENMMDGLPSWNKQSRNGLWEWRADAIYMPGALMVTDIRIRYNRYLPDFADSASTQWFEQPVPIMRSLDALSYFICAEIAEAREDLNDEGEFRRKGESAAKLMMNRDISMKQRVNQRRQSRSGRLEGSGDFGLCY